MVLAGTKRLVMKAYIGYGGQMSTSCPCWFTQGEERDVLTGYRTMERRVEISETKSRCEDIIKMDLRIRYCDVVSTATTSVILTTGRADLSLVSRFVVGRS
jgi:hypothetical protein